ALKLEVEGSDAENVCYLRHLNDANRLATAIQSSSNGKTVVIGGGYIGMECAASLVINKNQLERLFTPKIASLYEDYYRAKEVKFIKGTVLTSFEFD
uniref:FAD/NAD(P)-binding domain-containing protein n=2 Tax=Brassica oleracea TaxID=3712 RepID=A0A0D3CJ58_BRAOL